MSEKIRTARRAAVMVAVALLLCVAAALTSCAQKAREIEVPDGGVCRVYVAGDGAVCRLSVTMADGGEVVLRPASRVYDGGAGVEVVDINFDGNPDIRLPVRQVGEAVYYANFIRGGDGYYPVTALDALVSPEVDAAGQTVRSHYLSYTVEPATNDFPEVYIRERGVDIYVWRNGILTLSARESYTYYSENDIYCVARLEVGSDGELEAVSERWLSPEQYGALDGAPQLVG